MTGVTLKEIRKSYGQVKVLHGIDLEIEQGEFIVFVGPSGCGKSTLLRMIAGLETVTSGQMSIDGEVVNEVPPSRRGIAMVFQSYALYPHMTVEENIGFPLKVKGVAAADVRRQVADIAALVHIGELLGRRPAQLSGGQQQRVALARALIRRPDVLLLDEPLANLDAKLRLEMRSEIRRLQRETGITAILVTHDQVEAMSMCDRIAIMKQGEIVQIATPTDMYNDPRTTFVAGFLGNPPISFLKGTARGGAFVLEQAGLHVALPALAGVPDGTALILGVRPEYFGPGGAVAVEGRIAFAETQGRENLYDVMLPDGSVLRSIQPVRGDIGLGDSVRWGLDGGAVFVFAEDGRRL